MCANLSPREKEYCTNLNTLKVVGTLRLARYLVKNKNQGMENCSYDIVFEIEMRANFLRQ